jgi:acylphosphatase
MTVCKRVVYSGHVQGVGFRYTTHGLAQRYAVAGYVRNLSGGDVEVVAEGEPGEIERFLSALEERMAGYVDGKVTKDEPAGKFKGFVIRM